MRISPPVLTLLCLFVIGALDGVFPSQMLRFPGQIVIASAIGLAGLVLFLIAIRGFYRVETTVLPQEMARSSTLVTGGVYQISRNPMYLGMAAIIAGPGLALMGYTAGVGGVCLGDHNLSNHTRRTGFEKKFWRRV
jgi:protein-S-isoprenylcysteine O-methyltransferase Ste14